MRVLGIMLLFWGMWSCGAHQRPAPKPEPTSVAIDLDSLQKRGTLRLLTQNTSTSYFLYRGQPMGFDYDMVHAFADQLGLELEVVVKNSIPELFDALQNGEGDLIACNLTITDARQEQMLFSDPVDQSRMVLVQLLPRRFHRLPPQTRADIRIDHWDELAGDTVHVLPQSTFQSRLEVLNRDSALGVVIVPTDSLMDAEAVIAAVAEGQISYTLADENMARVNKTYYPRLDVAVPMAPPEPIGYAFRPTSPELRDTLNAWLAGARIQRKRNYLTRKYFDSPKNQRDRAMSDYSSVAGGRISAYDETIQREAERLGWDWKLLAALIYHESRFDPSARSWAGAQGLMQLMPGTGSRFGIDSTATPSGNIHAGVSYLMYLEKFWDERVPDPEERQYFILASYNIGPGHVLDAQCLAAAEGLDTLKWFDNVELMLARKSEKEFYRRDCVKHGYCRGTSATSYVRNIASHYRHYASILDES